MWFLRQMFRVSWAEKKNSTNSEQKRKILCKIRKRQAEILSNVTRKRNLEHPVTTGKIDGKETEVGKD